MGVRRIGGTRDGPGSPVESADAARARRRCGRAFRTARRADALSSRLLRPAAGPQRRRPRGSGAGQDTLLAIHIKRETYDRAKPFTAWAHAIARYKLIDSFRRNRIRRTEPIESAEDLFATEDTEEGAVKLDLDRLMADLPERQRALLEDVKLRGLSNAEAGKKAGMTETAVKVSIHRSLKALARRVRDED
jgi:RNA polymerase sigma factor (sigma-70 family)